MTDLSKAERLAAARAEREEAYLAWDEADRVWAEATTRALNEASRALDEAARVRDEAHRAYAQTVHRVRAIEAEP